MRNNNPLNIRFPKGYEFQGTKGKDGQGFCIFNNLFFGLRACFVILRTYARKYQCCTIRSIVSRWAPPTENNTSKYISDVAAMSGIDPDEMINYRSQSMRLVVKAMAKIESNWTIEDFEIYKAQQAVL